MGNAFLAAGLVCTAPLHRALWMSGACRLNAPLQRSPEVWDAVWGSGEAILVCWLAAVGAVGEWWGCAGTSGASQGGKSGGCGAHGALDAAAACRARCAAPAVVPPWCRPQSNKLCPPLPACPEHAHVWNGKAWLQYTGRSAQHAAALVRRCGRGFLLQKENDGLIGSGRRKSGMGENGALNGTSTAVSHAHTTLSRKSLW